MNKTYSFAILGIALFIIVKAVREYEENKHWEEELRKNEEMFGRFNKRRVN